MSTASGSTPLLARLNQGPTFFLLRRLHSLTGVLFGGYILVHLLVNATLVQGGRVFQTQVDKIHGLPFLPAIEWLFIYLPILYHTVYGIWITVTGQPNVPPVGQYGYAKNWAYVLQRATAIFLVFFIIYHVLSFKLGWFGTPKFDAYNANRSVAQHMDVSYGVIPWIMYPLGILAAAFHLANGFWTAAITWGLTVSAAAQRRWGFVCGGIFAFAFFAGLIAFISGTRLDPNAAPAVIVTH